MTVAASSTLRLGVDARLSILVTVSSTLRCRRVAAQSTLAAQSTMRDSASSNFRLRQGSMLGTTWFWCSLDNEGPFSTRLESVLLAEQSRTVQQSTSRGVSNAQLQPHCLVDTRLESRCLIDTMAQRPLLELKLREACSRT
eukprot:2090588-Rhodomonas_salina.1